MNDVDTPYVLQKQLVRKLIETFDADQDQLAKLIVWAKDHESRGKLVSTLLYYKTRSKEWRAEYLRLTGEEYVKEQPDGVNRLISTSSQSSRED